MATQITRKFIFLSLIILNFMLAQSAWCADTLPRFVRVAILKEAKSFTLAVKSEFKVFDRRQGQLLLEGENLKESKVTMEESEIKVGGQHLYAASLKVVPKKDATVYINGRRFRGEIEILKDNQNRFMVVNTIDLESYIKGVLYHEVSHFWPMESLKAQAIAARTYALYQIKANKNKDFDLTSDIYSQVYGGRGSERYRTNIAVERTPGLIMTYKGGILLAYYHATCAGRTEDADELWKDQNFPLLKEGVECHYCRFSPHLHWKKNFRLKDIQDKLNTKGYHLGLIKEISVEEKNASGRIKNLRITTRDGKTVTIAGKDFRDIIGPNLIRSNNYEIVMQGYYMDLIGKGWGHGVGMCQWGAAQMAFEGYTYDEILKFYYPGVEIVQDETQRF